MGENNTTSQISLLIALFIILLVLKLTGYITWSWWLVTAPLWGCVVLWVTIFIAYILFFGVLALLCI